MWRFIITIALLVMATVVNRGLSRPEPTVSRSRLTNFPRVIEDWIAVDEQTIGQGSMAVLQVDDYMMRTYANNKGEIIDLYIGYFKTQREGKRIHSPRQCLPGAGWTPVEASVYQIPVSGHNPGTVPVNRYLMTRGEKKQLYLFWYQGRGRIYANEYLNKLYLFWDALTKKRTDGALVRVNMVVASHPEQTLATEVDFIRNLLTLLPQYIPD